MAFLDLLLFLDEIQIFVIFKIGAIEAPFIGLFKFLFGHHPLASMVNARNVNLVFFLLLNDVLGSALNAAKMPALKSDNFILIKSPSAYFTF